MYREFSGKAIGKKSEKQNQYPKTGLAYSAGSLYHRVHINPKHKGNVQWKTKIIQIIVDMFPCITDFSFSCLRSPSSVR